MYFCSGLCHLFWLYRVARLPIFIFDLGGLHIRPTGGCSLICAANMLLSTWFTPSFISMTFFSLISSSTSLLCTLCLICPSTCPLPTLVLQLSRELTLAPRVSFLLGVSLQRDIRLPHDRDRNDLPVFQA